MPSIVTSMSSGSTRAEAMEIAVAGDGLGSSVSGGLA
jgi:hypothetical protein